jgi:pyridoxamine 5'-phosphate oxidase
MGALRDEIKKLREDFIKGTLTDTAAKADPFLQFEVWLSQAMEAKIPEVQAVNLATVSNDGKPSSRIVYLRELENHNFRIYTNYNSRKAKEMFRNPNVSLTFFWPELERQVRIEGIAKKADAVYSDTYFKNRPRESQIGAWASNQSGVLKNRDELEMNVENIRTRFEGKDIPRPEFWGGFEIEAKYYEFWQGRKSRLHDRISYTLEKDKWVIKRLAP